MDRPSPRAWLPVAAVGVLAYALWASRAWRIGRDAPIMLYQGYLMGELGWLPYRDFFDMNLPGTYAAYTALGQVFGFDDGPLLLADRLVLLVLMALIVGIVGRLSRPAGVLGAALFGLSYVALGPLQLLQRELLLLVPAALGVLAAIEPRLGPTWRAVLAGLGVGVAATIKPHAAILLVPILGYLAAEVRGRAVLALGGAALPGLACLAWLGARGLLGDFADSLGYLPYYGALDGQFQARAGLDRWGYIAWNLPMAGGHLVAVTGAMFALAGAARDRRVGLLAGLCVASWLYPAGSGQFWQYHWLPLTFWVSASAGLLLASRWRIPAHAAAIALVALAARGALTVEVPDRRYARADAIAAWLSEHQQPGDTVQPLDWACCAQHGMLQARAVPATRFLYTFHLYHHVSTPYIQGLRARFFDAFDRERPTFVVEVPIRPDLWVSGPDTVQELPELQQRLRERYRLAVGRRDLRIWVRSDVTRP